MANKEDKMTFVNTPNADRDRKGHSGYNEEIDECKKARNTQRNDTNPMIQKEGFLGVDDIDRLRRRTTY
jgi:hypothetical protein